MVFLNLFVGVFTEFYQSTARSLGVNESDVQALSAFAGSFVNHAATFFLNLVERIGHTVFHGKGNVLNAAAAAVLLNEFGDCAIGTCGFEKL